LSALLDEIRRIVADEGPITVERYMELALGHPVHGYYMTRDPLGLAGDFVTAPEISQMFGELIGLFFAQCWLDLREPSPVRLVECGPGRGTLMADALRAAKVAPGFVEALAVELIETSPVLRAAQERMLSASGLRVTWRSSLSELSAEGGPLMVVGNEFLDALPIRQYQRLEGAWRERLVGLEGGKLTFGLCSEPEAALKIEAPEGALLEAGFAARGFVTTLASLLKAAGGVAVFLDYGHARSGLGDTLQAMRAHAFVDPLASPGEADLTAHVDFEALAKAARLAGLTVHGPLEQGPFVLALGLEARAEQLIRASGTAGQREAIRAAERRLTEMTRTGMGRLFKAIAFTTPGQPVPPGFD